MSTNEAAERLRVYARQLPGFPFDLLDAALASQRSAEATHLWVGDHGVATGGNVERSAGAAPIEHPLGEVGHILAHYAIDDEDWEALRPFIRSAGAPLDVERLAYERGRDETLDRVRAMRLDFRTLPHREFPIEWPDWRDYEEVLPSYCGCQDCQLWRSGS